ncbi:MAG: Cobalt-zinc-cadmium resistance protein CzcD [Frankiales bacterium]|nr:Cobalt-zinc-cadmium resistance protein CzcD [Frankiales bacterium]
MTRALVVTGVAAVLLAPAVPASAHPLGNATVNHYDGLRVSSTELVDNAVEDIAEIPTYQRKPRIDTDGDGRLSEAERTAYASSQCAAMARSVGAVEGGKPVRLAVTDASYTERAGQVSLTTGRLACRLRGDLTVVSPTQLAFKNLWDDDGIGWHEITAVGTDVSLQDSPFPAQSISDELRRYPGDLLSSPLNVRSGTVQLAPGPGSSTYQIAKKLPVAGPAVRALNSLATTFNEVVGRKHLTVGVGLLALLLSMLLGAGHAFLPGHGKTIMAAYLVGRRGRLRDVVTVGATVTFTHTAGVLVLGLLISTTAAFAPTAAEQLLGIGSGAIVALVGAGLLVSALRNRHRPRLVAAVAPAEVAVLVGAGAPVHEHHDHEQHDHEHGHDHPHDHEHHEHHEHGHDHPHDDGHKHGWFSRRHSHDPEAAFSRGGLVGLGIAGGLVPSPSALLVLLAASALGRTVFGVVLVLGYGIGMALALCAAGLLLVRLRGRLERLTSSTRLARADRLLGALPVLTALLVLAVGVGLALRAAGGTV